MVPTDRWYVEVNGEIQVMDRASLQRLVREGVVTGSTEVSSDGITFKKASEVLPQAFSKPPEKALQIVQEAKDDEEWLYEKFLPVFSPAATLFVLLLTGWYLWGFLFGLLYVIAFLAIAGLCLSRGKITRSPALPVPTATGPVPTANPALSAEVKFCPSCGTSWGIGNHACPKCAWVPPSAGSAR